MIQDKDKIKLLYDAASSEYDLGSYEEFASKLQDADKRKALYDAIGSKYDLGSFEDFESKVSGEVKKKEESEPTSQMDPMDSELETTSSESKKPVDLGETVEFDWKSNLNKNKTFFQDQVDPLMSAAIEDFGKMTIDPATEAFTSESKSTELIFPKVKSDKDYTDEEVAEVTKLLQEAQSKPPSEYMSGFIKTLQESQENGDSTFFSWIKGLALNPNAIPEIASTMVGGMAGASFGSEEGAEAVVAGTAVGAGIGIAMGASGGPLGMFAGAISQGVRGAMSAVGGTMFAVSTYKDLLIDELGDKPLTEENIKSILDDEEKRNELRNKALAKGASMSAFDYLTFGIMGRVSKLTATLGKTKSALATTAVGAGLGGASSAGSSVVAGTEIDPSEVAGRVIIQGMFGAGTALAKAVGPQAKYDAASGKFSKTYKDFEYNVNNSKATKKDVSTILRTATDEQIKDIDIKIVGDEAMINEVETRMSRARMQDKIDPKITDKADRDLVITKEIEIKDLSSKNSVSSKKRIKILEKEISNIQEKYTETSEPIEIQPTKQEVKSFETKPSIEEPFMARTEKGKQSSLKVNFDSEGKIESVVNVKTGKQASAGSVREVEKQFLKNVFDVNKGKKAPEPQGLSERDIPRYVARESENVKEIVDAISFEKSQIADNKSMTQNMFDENGLANLKGFKFTSESWERMTGKTPKESKIDKLWIDDSRDKNTGKYNAGSVEDGWTSLLAREGELPNDVGSRVDAQDVIEFIQNNNTESKLNKFIGLSSQIQKTPELIELESKFTDLTGLQATPSNVEAVLSVDPERPPIEILNQADKERLLSLKDAAPEDQPGTFGKKRGASPEKLLGKEKKIVEVDEAKALRDQIKLEVKAAKDSKMDQTSRRKSLSQAISNLVKEGSIKAQKASQLINKISQVNLNNSDAVNRVLTYVENVFNDADYSNKINQANSLRKSIAKASKNKTLELNSAGSAKLFSEVDPLLVENIDQYLIQAVKVREGITPSTGNKIRPSLNIAETNKYSESQLKIQEDIKLSTEKDAFRELTGLSPEEFSLEDMREIVYGFNENQSGIERDLDLKTKAEAKKAEIRRAVDKAFKTVSSVSEKLLYEEIDAFTGEKIKLSDASRNIIKDFIKIETKNLSISDAVVALDALINFATNKTTGGMGSIVNRYKGLMNTGKALKSGLVAKKLSVISSKPSGAALAARSWNKYIASLPLTLEYMFKGQSKALMFEELSGFSGVKNGSAKAVRYANSVANKYSEAFKNKKPNGEAFNSVFNDVERGMLAFVRRSLSGEEVTEFSRRKSLIEQTIDVLSKRGGKESKLGETYKDVYDKILSDSNSFSEVESRVDNINLDAVKFITDVWRTNYPKLSELSENIYNKKLNKDINYTTDSLSRLKEGEKIGEIGESVFDFASKKVSDKKTVTLMEATRPSNLPKDRFVNLSFDSQNISNLERAAMDIETAPSIQQLKGFFESKNFERIVPDAQDRDLLKGRVIKYVQAKKGRDYISPDDKQFLKVLNAYSSFGVSRTLGGLTQPVKQTIPIIFNTMSNLGVSATIDAFYVVPELILNKGMSNFVKNSGYAIANRGIESISGIDSYNRKLENASKTNLGKAFNIVNEIQNQWLQKFLVAPDRYIAQASWIMYYLKDAKSRGVDIKNINWETLKLDKKSANYAQQQVDRQQNVSDIDLQGELFTSKKSGTQVLRKVVFSFANFLLNQKARMYSDITTAASKTSSAQDKSAAYRSLSGLVSEVIVFNTLGLLISELLSEISSESDLSEEEKTKKKQNRLKGRLTSVVTDILSPLPVDQVNDPIIEGINSFIKLISDSDDPYQLFKSMDKSAWERMGLLGIPTQKFNEWYEMGEMALGGTYERELPFGKKDKVSITEEGKESALNNWFSYTLYLNGLLPSEAGTTIKYNIRSIKKNQTVKSSKRKRKTIDLTK